MKVTDLVTASTHLKRKRRKKNLRKRSPMRILTTNTTKDAVESHLTTYVSPVIIVIVTQKTI